MLNQPLLIRRDTLLILDLGFHIFDGIRRLDLKGDGLTREGFHENLHLSLPMQENINKLLINLILHDTNANSHSKIVLIFNSVALLGISMRYYYIYKSAACTKKSFKISVQTLFYFTCFFNTPGVFYHAEK